MRHQNFRILTILLTVSGVGYTAVAAAGSPTVPTVRDDGIVLIDFNGHGSNAMAYLTDGMTISKSSTIRFMRLSPPISEGLKCCARVNRAPSLLSPHTTDVEVISTIAQKDAATHFTTVRLPKGQHPEPLVGIGFTQAVSKVLRENDHALLVKRPGGKGDLRVQHCLTSEAFTMRVVDVASSKERRRYYLPLGMDVEADCTEEIMPTVTE